MNFELNKLEKEKADKFIEEHKKCKNKFTLFSYIFTPTGIGYNVEIRCNSCGKTLDITDYTTW